MTSTAHRRTAESLEIQDVSVAFGGVLAVDSVDLEFEAGRLTGVIGPNGAGKTTLFDALSGLVPHTGRVLLGGRDLSRLSADGRARAGIGRSFQDARLFPGLSVRETIAFAVQRRLPDPGVAAQVLGWPAARASERALRAEVDDLVALFGLDPHADKFLSELSTGTRRIVDLAAVYARRPSVILLDEPSSGIAQREVEALGEVILRLREMAEATILVVEHDIPLVRQISERLVVMEAGRVLADGEPEAVLARPDVITSYLGTDEAALQRSGHSGSAGLVAVAAAAPDAVEGAEPPPGLPATDDFKLPARTMLEVAVAALAALCVAPFLLASAPPARVVADRAPLAQATPSPVPAPLAAAPLPGLQAPAPPPALPAFSLPSLGGYSAPYVPLASASPSPTPPAFPCAEAASPLPLAPSPLPTPVVPPTPCPLPSPSSAPLPAGARPGVAPSPTPS